MIAKDFSASDYIRVNVYQNSGSNSTLTYRWLVYRLSSV